MILPMASVLVSANEKKKHGPTLVERTKMILRRVGARLGSLIAGSQYRSGRMRGLVGEAVIPFMANPRRGGPVLRVDRYFRVHGSEEERAEYHKRLAVEAAYVFLKTQYGMAVSKVRGLINVTVYQPYRVLCHVLTMEAAENMGRLDNVV
jgi:hypothetical protein